MAGSLQYSESQTVVGLGPYVLGCLLRVLSEPTVFENYVHDMYVEDQLVELSLWDTAGVYPCVLLGPYRFNN